VYAYSAYIGMYYMRREKSIVLTVASTDIPGLLT